MEFDPRSQGNAVIKPLAVLPLIGPTDEDEAVLVE
jgi:hypothetical protein